MKLSSDLSSVIKTPVVFTGFVLIVIYTIFLTQIFYSKLVIDPWHERIHQKASSLAQDQAKKTEAYFETMNKKLSLIAQDRTLINLLKEENAADINEFKNLLRHQLPEMAEIKLVSANSPYFEETQNFVGITLAKNSIAGKRLEPTAVKLHDWLIVNATPVADDDEVVGSLIVSFSAQNLHPALNEADLSLGKTELLQYTRGFAPQVIISIGSSDTVFQADTSIKGRADWKLRYSASNKLVKMTAKPVLYFAGSFFALLVVSLLLLVLLVRYELARFQKVTALDESDLTPAELNQLIKENHVMDAFDLCVCNASGTGCRESSL